MKKQGREQFNYEVFKGAYDSDTRLQTLIKDFNKKQITLNGDDADEEPEQQASKNKEKKMNKKSDDLSDL